MTYASLGGLVEKTVTKKGVVKSLLAKLYNASESDAKGKSKAKEGQIRAFINEIKAQTGKCISSSDAAQLIALAKLL